LSFPFLSTSLILAANFTGIKALYNNRKLLEGFSNHLQKFRNRERVLWILDGSNDSQYLTDLHKAAIKQIQSLDLPVDMLVCSEKLKSDRNLIVVKPEFIHDNPVFKDSQIKIPDFLKFRKYSKRMNILALFVHPIV
jgi:hypothetical protein